MRRWFITASLLAIMFAQIAGMWLVYSTALMVHQELKFIRQSDPDKWEILNLTQEEFSSGLKEEDEILFDGAFYDIVSVQRTAQGLRVTAVRDTAENKLQKTLDGIQNDTQGWSELAHLVYDFSISPFNISSATVIVESLSVPAEKHFVYYVELHSSVFLLSPEYPPII